MENKQVTFQVPIVNMSWLKGRVEELNKKATKLGTEQIVVTVIRNWTKRVKDSEGRVYDKMMNEISISGIAPKIAGWSFLGTIQHTEAGNILRLINETSIPEQYRAVKQTCGHCNKDRNRKDTYLVTHEDGSFKQLGKSCLKDYTGHISPAHLAMLAEFIDQLNRAESGDYEPSSRFPMEVYAMTYLRMVCEAVTQDGAYITRKQSELSNARATSDYAWMSLFPPKIKTSFCPLTYTEAGETLFNKVVASMNELDVKITKSDFEHNVLMTFKKEMIQSREAGLLAAAIMIHERNLLKKINIQNNSDSKHIGTVKERSDFNVTITKKLGFETAFGYMMMFLMKDSDGNVLVWKTSSGFNNVSVGDELKIKATVKKHDEYQGVKQTILTRCVEIEEKEQEAIAN